MPFQTVIKPAAWSLKAKELSGTSKIEWILRDQFQQISSQSREYETQTSRKPSARLSGSSRSPMSEGTALAQRLAWVPTRVRKREECVQCALTDQGDGVDIERYNMIFE